MRSVGQILFELDRQELERIAQMTEGRSLRPVVAEMIEKRGVCELEEGALLSFAQPGEAHEEVCPGLLRALRPFLVAAALGIPSGEGEGYLLSCPSAKGTAWRVKALD